MVKEFFWMCSGADPDILQDCPKSEQIKYAGIGGTVFFTAVMAFVSSAYALYTVFDNVYMAVLFGLVWGLLIFNLDRFIVSTIKKRDSFWKELLQASPRIILALIIAVVISKPLELKIFEKEIDQVLLERKNQMTLNNQDQITAQFAAEIQRVESEIQSIKDGVTDKEKEVNDLYDTYISEAEGTQGTMKIGKGPVYKEKREKHDAQLKELQALKEQSNEQIAVREENLRQLRIDQKERLDASQPIIDGFDGLMARIEALGALPWFPSFFILLLFMAIETAPVFAKVMAPKGAYDMKFEEQEESLRVWVAQQKHQRDHVYATDIGLNEKVYYDVAEDEEVYAYKKQKAKELFQKQTDRFYKNQTDALH